MLANNLRFPTQITHIFDIKNIDILYPFKSYQLKRLTNLRHTLSIKSINYYTKTYTHILYFLNHEMGQEAYNYGQMSLGNREAMSLMIFLHINTYLYMKLIYMIVKKKMYIRNLKEHDATIDFHPLLKMCNIMWYLVTLYARFYFYQR